MNETIEPGLTYSALITYPEHVHAIGLITIEIASLESALARLFGFLTGMDGMLAEAVYLTPHSAFARLAMLETALSYLRVRGSPQPNIESIHARAKAVMGQRHELIHGSWCTGSDGAMRSTNLSWEKPTPVPIDHLTQLVRKIRTLNYDVQTEYRSHFVLKNRAASSPDKSRQLPSDEIAEK